MKIIIKDKIYNYLDNKSYFFPFLDKKTISYKQIYYTLIYNKKYYNLTVCSKFGIKNLSKDKINIYKLYNLLIDNNISSHDKNTILSINNFNDQWINEDKIYIKLNTNSSLIPINLDAIKYEYYNFQHEKLTKLLYININLDKIDISSFEWNNKELIYSKIINNNFSWESDILELNLSLGFPLIKINKKGVVNIIGLYFCKTVEIVNGEFIPLLWFIPSFCIVNLVKKISKNKSKIFLKNFSNDMEYLYENKLIKYYYIDNNNIKTSEKNTTYSIPKYSNLISYNEKSFFKNFIITNDNNMFLIEFKTYQLYNPFENIFFKNKNKYCINNIKNSKFYKNNKIKYIKYDNMIFMELNIDFINYILSNNLLINSCVINNILKNPTIINNTNFNKVILVDLVSTSYCGEYERSIFNNLVTKYLSILEYIIERPQICYLPILESINEKYKIYTLKDLNLIIKNKKINKCNYNNNCTFKFIINNNEILII